MANNPVSFESIFTSVLRNAINPDIESTAEHFEQSDGTDMVLHRKAYELVNAKGKTTAITINNPAIISAIESFKSADTMEKLSMYVKAKSLARMKDNIETIQSMGFKTVGKFAHHVLGIAEVTANQYANVGKYFLGEDYMPLSCFPANIEVTKLLEFLTYVVDDGGNVDENAVKRLYADGTLVDGMSQAKLRLALASAFGKLPAGEKSGEKSGATAQDFIDNIDSMEPVQAAAACLSALEIVRAIIGKFADFERFDVNTALANLESIADMARAMVDVK